MIAFFKGNWDNYCTERWFIFYALRIAPVKLAGVACLYTNLRRSYVFTSISNHISWAKKVRRCMQNTEGHVKSDINSRTRDKQPMCYRKSQTYADNETDTFANEIHHEILNIKIQISNQFLFIITYFRAITYFSTYYILHISVPTASGGFFCQTLFSLSFCNKCIVCSC